MDTQRIQDVRLHFGIIGTAPELMRAIDVALQVASTDLSVLVTGESGVGKEHFPKIIHQYSSRKHNTYIAVNCGAIPEGTIDSELFGHERGAFTGAVGERKGYFAEANGGTIFLDEIGELPLATQARLLRVLESGEYIRVGSSTVEKTNVRIVAATNVDLVDAIAKGRFRQDLYYRLCTIPIRVPALRERPDDIELLFRKFAFDVSEKYHVPIVHLSDDAKNFLRSYSWPGNIRQLKNLTERVSLLSEKREITADIIRPWLPPVPQNLPTLYGTDEQTRDESFANERELLYKVLFEMRRDITNLRQQLDDLVHVGGAAASPASAPSDDRMAPTIDITQSSSAASHISSAMPTAPYTPSVAVTSADIHRPTFGDEVVETVEESFSLQDSERELIRRALIRHRGRRKAAAAELQISERTLYRKIKQYNLEDL